MDSRKNGGCWTAWIILSCYMSAEKVFFGTRVAVRFESSRDFNPNIEYRSDSKRKISNSNLNRQELKPIIVSVKSK